MTVTAVPPETGPSFVAMPVTRGRDILTAGMALVLLAAQLVIAVAHGGLHWPDVSLIGQVPVVGFVLGSTPEAVVAIALSLDLCLMPAMILSRNLITPLWRVARGHGRAAFVATAIALGLLTVVLLWTPLMWLAMLGLRHRALANENRLAPSLVLRPFVNAGWVDAEYRTFGPGSRSRRGISRQAPHSTLVKASRRLCPIFCASTLTSLGSARLNVVESRLVPRAP